MPLITAVLNSGTEIAGFRIESLLAEGGMGTVYLAMQERLDRKVALKVLSAERSGDEEFQERFIRESQLAASLDHPNVLPVYDAGEADGVLYLAMRYVDGGDLRRLLREHGRVSALLALDISRQIALALEAAHAAGLVHRDVKPANILLGSNDHAYLADFGLARSKDTRGLTLTGTIMGTPDYAAPEQLEGVRALDGRADIYSLGCVLYHCLAGQPPYVRESDVGVITAHLHDPTPQLAQLRPDLPPAVGAIVNKAMEKDRSKRYSTARELAAELGAVLADLGGLAGSSAPSADDSDTRPIEVDPPVRPGHSRTVLDRVDAQTPMALANEPGKRRKSRLFTAPSRRVSIGLAAGAVIAIGALVGGLLLRDGKASAPSIAPPRAITGLTASPPKRRGNQAILRFDTHPSKLRPIKSLQVQTKHSGHLSSWKPLAATNPPATVRGLKNGQQYQLHVRACNKRCGRPSGWATTRPYGRPQRPRAIAATPSPGSVYLKWDAGRGNGRGIEGYLLTVTINGKRQRPVAKKGLNYTIDLGYPANLKIKIVAIDKTGWRSAPASVSTHTDAEPVSIPTAPSSNTPPTYQGTITP